MIQLHVSILTFTTRSHVFLRSVHCILWLITLAFSIGTAQVAGPFTTVYREATNYRGTIDALHILWFEPSRTQNTPLPLIIWIHGGAFYAGNYRDMEPHCRRWAQHGYIAASVQYRLGYHSPFPLEAPYAYDRAEVVRACWRAMQDVRNAIHAIVQGALITNVDTSRIILAGESAGAIIAMQVAIADEADSIPQEVRDIASAQYGLNLFQRPSLGDINGDPLSARPPTRPLPRICCIINRYGALMLPHMLQPHTFPPLFSYHQRGDLVVACGIQRGLWGLPFGVGDNFPILIGSCAIQELLADGGHPSEHRETLFVDGFGHELHNREAVEAAEDAFVVRAGCNAVPVGVEEVHQVQSNSTSQPWYAYDVLGRLIAWGTGTVDDVRAQLNALQSVAKPSLSLIRIGNRTVVVW